jgi:hypothetical protein
LENAGIGRGGDSCKGSACRTCENSATTLAGIVACLDYVISQSKAEGDLMFEYANGGDDEIMDFVRSLARGARQIAPRAVQS